MQRQIKNLLRRVLVKIHPGDEMRELIFGRWLLAASGSGRLADWSLKKSKRLEGGEYYSVTARRIMQDRYGIAIGAYSYGSCFEPGAFGPGTVVGRYVSIGPWVRAYRANHPLDRLSTHAFFFNSALGFLAESNVPLTSLVIEHDAWIGQSVIITPRCRRIGLGAVVGAGSIVIKDVPDFAVVAGNPARIIKWRFPSEMQACVRNSRWWELPASQCAAYLKFMSSPLEAEARTHPLLAERPPS